MLSIKEILTKLRLFDLHFLIASIYIPDVLKNIQWKIPDICFCRITGLNGSEIGQCRPNLKFLLLQIFVGLQYWGLNSNADMIFQMPFSNAFFRIKTSKFQKNFNVICTVCLIDSKSAFYFKFDWCCHATKHYLNQRWSRSPTTY